MEVKRRFPVRIEGISDVEYQKQIEVATASPHAREFLNTRFSAALEDMDLGLNEDEFVLTLSILTKLFREGGMGVESLLGLLVKPTDSVAVLNYMSSWLEYLETLGLIATTGTLLKSRFYLDDDDHVAYSALRYPPPLIVPPKILRDIHESGYYTFRESRLVNTKTSDYKEKDLCLDTLNYLNSVPIALVSDFFQEGDEYEAPEQKPDESDLDYASKLNSFYDFFGTTFGLMQELREAAPTCYVSWFYDTRGRMYAGGYEINPQGTSLHKVVVQDACGQILTGSIDDMEIEDEL